MRRGPLPSNGLFAPCNVIYADAVTLPHVPVTIPCLIGLLHSAPIFPSHSSSILLSSTPYSILSLLLAPHARSFHPTPYALTSQRNQYPAAVLKDRHSRTGLDKTQWDHKNGDGAHNWGSTARKGEDEATGRMDGEAEAEAALDEMPSSDVFDLDEEINDPVGAMPVTDAGNDFKPMDLRKRGSIEGQSNIATSPTDSMGSMDNGDRPGMGRRMSAVSDEEREQMRLYREGVLHNKQGWFPHPFQLFFSYADMYLI